MQAKRSIPTWNEDAHATGYELQYREVGASDWTIAETQNFTGIGGKTYEIRVKACGTGNHSDSEYATELITVQFFRPRI